VLEIEPLPGHSGYEFEDKIVGGVIPKESYRPSKKEWRKPLPAVLLGDSP